MSRSLFQRAQESVVGGVNSPVRSFRAVGAPPLFIERGDGAYLYDADGHQYVDFLMSWGAIILGHAHPIVRWAIEEAAQKGNGYGLSTPVEAELAELIRKAFPSIEKLRMVNSGTEAVMSAVRLARGFTHRDKIIAFEGCYHGHSDGLLARAGSGLATFGIPASAGVPASFTAETLLAHFNDLSSVETILKAHGDKVAAILVEPVAGNMGVVAADLGFLQGLRALCDRHGALLILDEVISGFRIAWGGAQERYGLRADLTTLGKIIGGGLPVGAFGGRRDIMEHLAPLGQVYQAGTLSGNPVVARAGLAALKTLKALNPYSELEDKGRYVEDGLKAAAAAAGVPVQVGRVAGMFTPFFTDQPVRDYASARTADAKRYAAFFTGLLDAGVLLPPSQWEASFISAAHKQEDLNQLLRAARQAFAACNVATA